MKKMMKKVMVMVLAVTIAFTCTGCITGRIYGKPLEVLDGTENTEGFLQLNYIRDYLRDDDLEKLNKMGYHAGESDAETFEDFWQQWLSLKEIYGVPSTIAMDRALGYGDEYVFIGILGMENGGELVLQAEFTQRYELVMLDIFETAKEFLENTKMPEGIEEIDVIVGEGTPYETPGKITRPIGCEQGVPLKAAVLVGGDGGNTMDMAAGNTYLYRDLAWKLAQEGIVTIRYDKRNLTYKDIAVSTSAGKDVFTVAWEYTDDANTACRMLQALPYVDADEIFYIGHSQGAQVASRADAEGGDLYAGFILINTSPRPWYDVIYDQYINYGLIDRSQEQIYYLVSKIDTERKFIADGKCAELDEEEQLADFILSRAAAFWVDLLSFDYVQALKDAKKPTFILQGDSDYQVTTEADFSAWEKEMQGEDWCTLKCYDGLNHLLCRSEGIFAGHYMEFEKPHLADETALNDICAFILAN